MKMGFFFMLQESALSLTKGGNCEKISLHDMRQGWIAKHSDILAYTQSLDNDLL